MKRGLVIGKFYPPHRGHKYLIDFASQRVDSLVVVVCDRSDQSIPGALRAKWLREIHPNVEVMVVEDIGKDDDSEAWANYTKSFLGYTPDVVFTSEDYGDSYARCLGCKHVLIDKARVTVPISATKIRSNPLKYWDFLEPCVKSYFAKRICLVGAESTGTTTLAKDLAAHYQTNWVPEFGRLFCEGKMPLKNSSDWQTDEFTFIASIQNQVEDFFARKCNKLLICDTDSFATSIWHDRYLGFMADEVNKVSANRDYDLYILTGDEIPFVQDGTRDGEHIRHQMHQRFELELRKQGKRFIVLRGDRASRLSQALVECDKILNETVDFSSKSIKLNNPLQALRFPKVRG